MIFDVKLGLFESHMRFFEFFIWMWEVPFLFMLFFIKATVKFFNIFWVLILKIAIFSVPVVILNLFRDLRTWWRRTKDLIPHARWWWAWWSAMVWFLVVIGWRRWRWTRRTKVWRHMIEIRCSDYERECWKSYAAGCNPCNYERTLWEFVWRLLQFLLSFSKFFDQLILTCRFVIVWCDDLAKVWLQLWAGLFVVYIVHN